MRPILVEIPTPFGSLPLFSFGLLLLLAFVIGVWIVRRRARQAGLNPDLLWDIGVWMFLTGIVGARILHMIQFPTPGGVGQQIGHFFKIWEGGLIFYGSIVGGFFGFLAAYFLIIRKHGLNSWQLTDIFMPCVALGIFFGRLGCFLNGCCYGNVADPVQVPEWRQVHFPALSVPHQEMVKRGYQTAFGFIVNGDLRFPQQPIDDSRMVKIVEPHTPAAEAGLRVGDVITRVGDDATPNLAELKKKLGDWPSGEPLRVTVERSGQPATNLSFAYPASVALHPTQIYSALDGLVLFFVLSAYYPLRRRHGEVCGLFLVLYAIDRFFIEQLRTDTPPVLFGLTLSQNISIASFLAGVGVLAYVYWFTPPIPQPAGPLGKPDG
jgi:phosphatidylglycerol:prolipoprotein diacylglycerol transferase